MFEGRNLLIATKHQKEKVIASILDKELGVKCFVSLDFDSDQLGTFSGEIERKDDPITTVRKKCILAMEQANCDLAIASEGSFGSHPELFFVPANDEFLYFIDKKNNLEIFIRELSTETNLNSSEVKTEKELLDFANKANFPSHALIIRKSKTDLNEIVKGIRNEELLKTTFHDFFIKYGSAYIETDMRAMFNPKRMQVIERATKKLVEKIKNLCPECKTPGFGITDSQQGLPCKTCSSPTRSTLSFIYSCKKCNFTESKLFPNGKKMEDPTYCDRCNP